MLGGWLSGHWVVPHRGTGEPEAGVQVAPLPAGALQPLTSVGTFCWAPGEGSPLPEWGMGERRALAPLKTLPREVRAETEGLLFLLSLGSVSLETGGETARRCGLPGPPKEGASGAQGSVLVGRLGSLGAEGM